MESIFFDLNPSMKQFTDNALRANNMLHKAQHHESKAKTSKASKAAGSNIGTDTSDTAFSSDDMMGGMDLGDYRGGGSSSFESFRQSDDDSDSSDRRTPNLSAMMSYVKNSSSDSDNNIYQDRRINSDQPQVLEIPSNVINNENNFDNKTEEKKEPVSEKIDNDYSYPQEQENQSSEAVNSNRAEFGKEPNNISFEDNSNKENETINNNSESKNLENIDKKDKEITSKSQEKVVISEESKRVTEEKKEQKVEVKKESAWNSLLSFDEGFLIATDEKFLQFEAMDEINPNEPKAVSQETISVSNVNSSVSEAEILNSMIPANVFGDYEHSMLIYYLSFYGKKILKLCADFGIKILPNGLNGNLGRYSKNEKACFILPSSLNSSELFVAPRLYMAVAFDHALGGEDFSSEKSPAVLSNWQLCRDRIQGHLFQDKFSASNPSRYFAQSIESFLRQKDECPNSYFFNHEQLYDYDRSMFSYIEYLFNQMKG